MYQLKSCFHIDRDYYLFWVTWAFVYIDFIIEKTKNDKIWKIRGKKIDAAILLLMMLCSRNKSLPKFFLPYLYVLNIFRQRAARGHWADRWGSEWNRQTKWASQWRNSQSWTKVQQATATLLLEAIRPYSKNTKLLGDSCILSCDNCWKCRPRVWKTLANNDFFYSVISDLKMFCIEFCFPYKI